MAELVRQADLETTRTSSATAEFVLEFKAEKLFDLTVKSYEFVKEIIKPEDREKYPPWVGEFIMKKTDTLRGLQAALPVPGRARPQPEIAGRICPVCPSSRRRWPT